jgi:hypothetical protein
VHEIHEAFMMIVVVSTLGSIHRQHQIIGTQAVSLGISIGEDTGLQKLVVCVVHPRDNKCWAESKLLIFSKEVINVPV